MHKLTALLVCGLLLVGTHVDARTPTQHPRAPATTQVDEDQLIEHGHYTNKSGQSVHSPAHTKSGKAPQGATAQCRDGSYSFSRHRSGTCSGHGGVGNWL
jgi:hypothetical protein